MTYSITLDELAAIGADNLDLSHTTEAQRLDMTQDILLQLQDEFGVEGVHRLIDAMVANAPTRETGERVRMIADLMAAQGEKERNLLN